MEIQFSMTSLETYNRVEPIDEEEERGHWKPHTFRSALATAYDQSVLAHSTHDSRYCERSRRLSEFSSTLLSLLGVDDDEQAQNSFMRV